MEHGQQNENKVKLMSFDNANNINDNRTDECCSSDAHLNTRCRSCPSKATCLKIARQNRFEGAMEMAGAMAHELNQILQQVMGYSDLISYEAEKLSGLIVQKQDSYPLDSDQINEISLSKTETEALETLDSMMNVSGKLCHAADEMGKFAWKIASVQDYRTREYLPGKHIFDLDFSGERKNLEFNSADFSDHEMNKRNQL